LIASQLYVVELGRKPLFPGIYTPVMIQKNERLLKEIADMRRQG
jgi:Lon-like ATP-dependent protease